MRDYDEDVDALFAVVPAAPGFEVVRVWIDEDDYDGDGWLTRHPILAWAISRDGIADPIALDQMDYRQSTERAVVYPDGRVVICEDAEWASLDEWLPVARERARHRLVMRRRRNGVGGEMADLSS